jgi:hypothetical protein
VQIYTGEIIFDYNREDFSTTDQDLVRSYIPKADLTILQYTPDHPPIFTVVGSMTWMFDETDPCEAGVTDVTVSLQNQAFQTVAGAPPVIVLQANVLARHGITRALAYQVTVLTDDLSNLVVINPTGGERAPHP